RSLSPHVNGEPRKALLGLVLPGRKALDDARLEGVIGGGQVERRRRYSARGSHVEHIDDRRDHVDDVDLTALFAGSELKSAAQSSVRQLGIVIANDDSIRFLRHDLSSSRSFLFPADST